MPRFIVSLAASVFIAAIPGCRSHAPISGTPIQAGESLDFGIDRGQNVYSVRQTDLLASTEKMAGDIAAVVGHADGPTRSPVGIVLRAERNHSSLPSSSHSRLMSQLWHGLRDAGPAHGLEFFEAGDEVRAATAAYDLWTDLSSSSSGKSRTLFIDYHLAAAAAAPIEAPAPERVVWGRRYLVMGQ